MGRRRASVASEEVSEMSPTGSDSSIYSDKKKQTHLRCERQRREAINNGYLELKELIPQTPSAMGCKTTNAAILFRACEHMSQLTGEVEAGEKELQQLAAQVSALEMIAAQYETMTAETPSTNSSSLQAQMVRLKHDCFGSFLEQVDFSSYATITRTLLTWVEQLAAHNEQFKPYLKSVIQLNVGTNICKYYGTHYLHRVQHIGFILQYRFTLVRTRTEYSIEYAVFGGSSYSNYFREPFFFALSYCTRYIFRFQLQHGAKKGSFLDLVSKELQTVFLLLLIII
uniref:BHLH domain-containing protein n=1 Tax=Heterorhabditis bacteriophora TaxID=37862 RepID=A0A1I7WQS6_HETBA